MSVQNNDGSLVLSPKESGEFIVKKAKDVSVSAEGIIAASNVIMSCLNSGPLRNFKQCELHPKKADEKAIDWIFLVDTLNFSFWTGICEGGKKNEESDPPKWEVAYKGKSYTGYFALCAGVNRALEEGLDVTNPKVYGSLTTEDILQIFRSETSTPIPLVEDRVANLKEAGRVLLDKYDGSFVNCIKSCDKSVQRLMDRIVEDFSSYRDQSRFENVTVSIFKRLQILIADIWSCYDGQGIGTFNDIDTITMFADYRIPQVLLHFGALKYSPELLSFLEKDELLESGDRREVEIRGASIQAVELIKAEIRKRLEESGRPVELINAILIDHFLWDYRRDNAEALEKYPYHKTRCIYY